jgi:hypothetical protein
MYITSNERQTLTVRTRRFALHWRHTWIAHLHSVVSPSPVSVFSKLFMAWERFSLDIQLFLFDFYVALASLRLI